MKKMFKKSKKGFTLVELVVVIAVIAILGGVSIAAYLGITNKANESNDVSMVQQLNTALIADKIEHTHPTMYDALQVAKREGIDLTKVKASAKDNEILWDSVNDLFCYYKGGEKFYYPSQSTQKVDSEVKFWVVSNEMKADRAFSTYYIGSETEITTSKGFDAGETNLTKVTYTNQTKQDVVIRTLGNMCHLVIKAPADHIDHYGYAMKTSVVKVDNSNSYHEFGTSTELAVTDGKVVIENTGVVFELKREDYNDGTQVITYSTTNSISNNGGNILDVDEQTIPTTEVKPSTSFEINSLAQLEAFRDATNSGATFDGVEINLNCDVALKDPWKPISNYYRKDKMDNSAKDNYGDFDLSSVAFQGTFNGNGHTISGLTNKGLGVADYNTGYNNSTPAGRTEAVYGLFALVYDGAKISNLKLTNVNIDNDSFGNLLGDSVGAVIGYTAGSVTLEDITVSGKVSAYDSVGGIIGCSRYFKTMNEAGSAAIKNKADVTLKGCSFEGTVNAQRRAAGLIAQVGGLDGEQTNYGSLKLENCSTGNATINGGNKGTDSTTAGDDYYWVGGLVAHLNIGKTPKSTVTITNCVESTNVTCGLDDAHIRRMVA